MASKVSQLAITNHQSLRTTVLLLFASALLPKSHSANDSLEVSANVNCVCPGDVLAYTCNVNGAGTTLWGGSAFDCSRSGNEILLRHSQFAQSQGTTGSCNNGAVVARSIGVTNGCYTSELSVTVSTSLNNKTIQCSHDSSMGMRIIDTSTAVIAEPEPPDNVHFVDFRDGQVILEWRPAAISICLPLNLNYTITSNCSTQCYIATMTNSTIASCPISPLSMVQESLVCTFSVQNVVCGNLTGRSSSPMVITIQGSSQTPPAQCMWTFRIEQDRIDIYITPGIVNCFSCALDSMGGVNWQVELDGDLVPASLSPDAATDGNLLVIAMPDNYIQPGTGGRRDIVCTSAVNNAQNLEARLASPVLRQPLFPNITVNEGGRLEISCITRNIPDIITFRIRNPSGISVSIDDVFSVPNVTRAYAGTYSCVIRSILNNSTVSSTSVVIIQYSPEVTAYNSSSHDIILGEELCLQCGFVGVPAPSVCWFRDDVMLRDGVDGVSINMSNSVSSILIGEVEATTGGTYICRANNTVGTDQESYSVTILISPDPVTNLILTSIGEREVSLSWLITSDRFTPITAIEVDVIPATGIPFKRVLGNVNMTTITGLMPFREYKFSIAVVNRIGPSEKVNITASTLSLSLGISTNLMFVAGSSTSIVLSWAAPMFDPTTTDDPNFYIAEFSHQDGSDHITRNVPASTSPLMLTFDNLMKDTSYRARIVAYNDRGVGTFTDFLTAQTNIDSLDEPRNVQIEGVGATVLYVSWKAPANNGGRPIINYSVTLNELPFFIVEVGSDTFSLLIRNAGLTENTTYTVKVAAANELGFGVVASSTGRTQLISEPQKIFDLPISESALSTTSSAVLTWQFPGGTVNSYIVQYVMAQDSVGFGSSDAMKKSVNGSMTSIVIDRLLPGATYKFRVAVVNNRGMSLFSECGIFLTLAQDATSMPYQCTTAIAFASVLSVVLAVCVVIFTTVIIVLTRSKKPAQPEAYYDTVNIHHNDSPPPVINTEKNVAYGHTKL